nr:ferrochelatase [uncultured Rhodopila sp.]
MPGSEFGRFERNFMAGESLPSGLPETGGGPDVPASGRRRRVAIVLFNLGGPDSPEAIRPFLMNLFQDPAILRVPFFIRPFLARIIAKARVPGATANYALLGGRSPLLGLTRDQAAALEAALPELDAKCFIAMRYWHPFSLETALAVKAWDPDEIVLLPLYPHFSTTTTGSSVAAWREASLKARLLVKSTMLCCYPTDAGYIKATTALVKAAYAKARAELDPSVPLRVLFSAHGLPEIIIKNGDPYQWQVEQTVSAVVAAWGGEVDWSVCYQSRATPQKWIDPSTESEIERAAKDKTAVLVVPIAFVSEHTETLVELDVEYRDLAVELGVPGYFRVPTQNSDVGFIASLGDLVRRTLEGGSGLCSQSGGRICADPYGDCPFRVAGLG